ncbi:hypothetical protein CMV_017948 [Castanea mollissima]|uniref:Uncharacterized protein n=1 Tax=Castanea mollissima TaxID=60419 RepID=A0A8J4R0V0_9ROSI|nr:hypothetical protein CMV_017948 [Castanea mollissima]
MNLCSGEEEENDTGERRHWESSEFDLSRSIEDLEKKKTLEDKIQSGICSCVGTNISDVFDYDPDLYTKMVRYPLEVLAIFDIVLNLLMSLVGRINPLFENHIQTRIFNLQSSTSVRNLNPSDVEVTTQILLF